MRPCMTWHLPPRRRNGGGVETCVPPGWLEATNTLFLYMFLVFPLFSLSTCVRGARLLWMCASFDLFPSPGCGSHQLKPPLMWGSSMGFLSVLFSLHPLPSCLPPSLYSLSLSIFIVPCQVLKRCGRRSLEPTKMLQG